MYDISLSLYKTFCVVAQSKNYVDASNKLHISTTAISKNIRQLESLLKIVKALMQNGKKFTHTSLKKFYDSCTDTSVLKSSTEWSAVVEHSIEQMREELIA